VDIWNDFCDVVDHDYYVNQLKSYGLNHLPTPLNEIEVMNSLVLDDLILILHLVWPPRHLGEVSLSANQKKSEMRKKLQWHIEGAAVAGDSSHKNTPHGDPMIKNTPRRDPMIKNSSCGDQ
jgi:hypothetical protein